MFLKKLPALLFTAVAFSTALFLCKSDLTSETHSFLRHKIEKELNEKPRNGFPDEAIKFYFEQRAYPSGKIPSNWREKALREIRENNLWEGLPKTAKVEWTELGPNNIGGRVRSIVVSPANSSVVFAASVSGGVWKSTNGGESWFPLKDSMENLAVSSLAIDPKNPEILWAGTGEGFYNLDALRGAGIFKTTDGGESWFLLPSTQNNANFYYVNKLVYDSTTSTLWAGTRKGLFKSTDGGATFRSVITGQNKGNIHCTDLEIAYSTPTKIFAAFGLFNQSVIYRSTNAGNTWEQNYKIDGTGRIELAVSPSNPNVVYASFMDLQSNGVGKMAKSTDGGENWATTIVPGPAYSGYDNYGGKQAWYNNILAVKPSNPDFVLAGGIDLWGSEDGGQSWTQISNWYNVSGYQYIHADLHAIAFDPNNENNVFVGCDGGIFKSTDGGFTWRGKNEGLAITQFYYGAVEPQRNVYYGGTQDNGTLKSSGSLNWSAIMGGDGGATEVDFQNVNTVYMEYVRLTIFKSTDGGATFHKAMTGMPVGTGFWDGIKDRTLFISPFVMDPNNPKILVAGTYRIWKTTNGAASWTAISEDLTGDGTGSNGAKISALAIAPGNSNVIYAGCSNGKAQVTTDNGNVWNDISSGLPNLYCTGISVLKNHPEVALFSFSGFYAGKKVYKTTDYGASWTNISGNLPNIPVNDVLLYPENENIAFAGTDLGVFVTLDGGTSWTKLDEKMPNVAVFDLVYREHDNSLFAFTHGRGVFRADITNLTAVNSPVKNLPEKLALSQNYPNPFNPNTHINFTLPTNGFVTLEIFNALGQKIETLVQQNLEAGNHTVEFNGRELTSGTYIYRLTFGNHSLAKKMILLK